MLVFGVGSAAECPAAKIARIREDVSAAETRHGIERHGLIVSALIEAGELWQGIEDAECAVRGGVEDRSRIGQAAGALTLALARAVAASWAGAESIDFAPTEHALAALEDRALPASVDIRPPEGFHHYAVYPEAYLEAARALGRETSTIVLGLRSIGTTLASMAAAALDGPVPVTARPSGHPFAREIVLGGSLQAEIRASGRGAFAVVDEGPGLSGSSFLAAAAALEGAGVPAERIHLFPSHGNPPGAEASDEARARWRGYARHHVSFEDAVLDAPRPGNRLAGWVADLVGEATAPMDDFSAGRWRTHHYADEADWPAAHPWGERRKYLWRAESGAWLVKFEGLGRVGRRRLDHARELAAAGFTTEPAGWRHGFLIERWLSDARPLGDGDRLDATQLARVADYLSFRARTFPNPLGHGALLHDLATMSRHNVAEALGPEAAHRLAWLDEAAVRLQGRVRACATDNRLHRWEWLVRDGTLIKADALHHHAGHDLIGSQDVAYDVAALGIEFCLGESDESAVTAHVERGIGRAIDPELIAIYRVAYLAFQLGWFRLAARSSAAAEANRLESLAANYATILARQINGGRGLLM